MTVLKDRVAPRAGSTPSYDSAAAGAPRPGSFRTVWAGAVVLLSVALGACGQEDGDPQGSSTPQPTTTTTQEPTVKPHDDPTTVALNDLATRLDLTPEEISVVSTEEVEWRDGSLGCAQKGMAYTQAIVPGLRITLAADGQEYAYHQGRSKAPFLCEHPTQ